MKKVILLSFIILFSISTFAQWKLYRKSPPNVHLQDELVMGTDKTGFLVIRSSLTDNAIYSTMDGGRIWNSVYTFGNFQDTLITSPFIGDLAAIIIGNQPIVTTNGGRTWEEKVPLENFDIDRYQMINDTLSFFYGYFNSPPQGFKLMYTIDILFFLDQYPGLVGGTMPPGSHNPNDCFYFFGIDKGFYILENGKTFFTNDRGVSWQERDSIPVTLMQEVYFYDENIGFAFGTGNGETFKTTDGGVNWQTVSIPIESNSKPKGMEFTSADSVYLLTFDDLLFSSDGGTNWSVIYDSYGGYLNNLSVTENNLFLSVTAYPNGYNQINTSYSSDNGDTWNTFTFPHTMRLNVEFINDSTAFMCGGDGMSFNPYFIETTDAFNTMTLRDSTELFNGNALNDISMANDTVGYIGLAENSSFMLKTTDAWQTVFTIGLPSSIMGAPCMELETYGDSLVFGNFPLGKNLLSRDAGNTWIETHSYQTMNGMDFFFLDENNFYYAMYRDNYGYVDHSSDGGETWERWTVADTSITCVYFHDENTGWAAGRNGTIVYTTDGGNTWHESFVSQPHSNIGEITFLNDMVGYALSGAVLYKTTDGGLNWGIQDMDGESGFRLMRFTDENTGYVFGQQGLIMRTLNAGGTILSTDEEPDVLPTEYVLRQNYPNPFNPSTIIEFSIPEAADVSITIFNVLGEEIKQLVNSRHNPGNYKIEFDSENLTSGIYFYRIQSNTFSATKKMLLIR